MSKYLPAALLAALLAGCGGGGESDDAFKGTGTTGGTGGTGGTVTQAVQLGSGTGAGFSAGSIAISSANVSAGGSTSLSVTAQRADGTLFTDQATITFNSPCVAAGTAEIQPAAVATTSTGIATVTYVAKGCAGSDVISATSNLNGVARTATGTVNVAQAAIGSIAFVSASPTNIALRGTGSADRPESSTLVFRVRDAAGGARPGASVSFALNTTVGGITLQPSSATATSDAQGNVQIVVNAGTVAASVRVTATITSTTPQISTQSSLLTITTGLPVADSMSVAVGCFNVEGLDIDGTTTPITVRLADRFRNPVPDGTAVTFTAEGGAVQAQCVTETRATESGVCTVNWTSTNPRPANGRVTLLAKAIGEEAFRDSNGNGSFDAGESFTDQGEPYRDDDESGTYVAGTDADFFDFNSNGLRDGPDGIFNGALCNDPARCGAASTRSAGIGNQAVVIMSGTTPVVSDLNDPIALSPISMTTNGGSRTVDLWIRDRNGNPMPGNTVVTAQFSGAAAVLAQPNTFTVPCAQIPAGSKQAGITRFSFSLTDPAAGSGVLIVTVRPPSAGSQGGFVFTIPVTVTST